MSMNLEKKFLVEWLHKRDISLKNVAVPKVSIYSLVQNLHTVVTCALETIHTDWNIRGAPVFSASKLNMDEILDNYGILLFRLAWDIFFLITKSKDKV